MKMLSAIFRKLFGPTVVSSADARGYAPYTIEELWQIIRFGRSTDPQNPLARQTSREALWLLNEHLLQLRPRSILEVGIASGGTTLLLCKVFPEARVYGMDLTDAIIPDELRDHPAFHMIVGNSNDPATRDLLTRQCDSFDFILIDGDHSEPGVMKDMELYLPLLRDGGLVVFHDVRLDPPRGIKPTWYGKIKRQLPDASEYYVDENNNGYGYWYKHRS